MLKLGFCRTSSQRRPVHRISLLNQVEFNLTPLSIFFIFSKHSKKGRISDWRTIKRNINYTWRAQLGMAGKGLSHEYSKPQRPSPTFGSIFRIWTIAPQLLTAYLPRTEHCCKRRMESAITQQEELWVSILTLIRLSENKISSKTDLHKIQYSS